MPNVTYPNLGNPGDTVDVPVGSYNVASFALADGRAYVGHNAVLTNGVLDLPENAQKISLRGFKFVGAWVRGAKGSKLGSVDVTRNEFANVPNGCPAIKTSVRCANLTIERNYFHDFDHWGTLIDGGCDAGTFRWNVGVNLRQLIHTMGVDNFLVERNVAIGLQRMLIEMQEINSYAEHHDNLIVHNNAAWDWRTLYWDSFLLSIMPQAMTNVSVVGNYGRMNKTGGWEQPDSTGTYRAGIGIELGFDPRSATVSGNTIACPVKAWTPVIASVDNLKIDKTSIYYDAAMYPPFAGESGVKISGIGDGVGSAIPTNTITGKYADCPAPPAWAVARLANPMGDLPTVEETSSGVDAASSINPVTPHQVGLTVTFDGRQPGAQIHYRTIGGQWVYVGASNVLTVTADQANNTWKLEFRQVLNSTESPVSSIQLQPVAAPVVTVDPRDATIADLRGQLAAVQVASKAVIDAKNAALLDLAAKAAEAAK